MRIKGIANTVTDSYVSAVTAFLSWSAWATVGGSIWGQTLKETEAKKRLNWERNACKGRRQKAPEREACPLSSFPCSARRPCGPGSRRRPGAKSGQTSPKSPTSPVWWLLRSSRGRWWRERWWEQERVRRPLTLAARLQNSTHSPRSGWFAPGVKFFLKCFLIDCSHP